MCLIFSGYSYNNQGLTPSILSPISLALSKVFSAYFHALPSQMFLQYLSISAFILQLDTRWISFVVQTYTQVQVFRYTLGR